MKTYFEARINCECVFFENLDGVFEIAGVILLLIIGINFSFYPNFPLLKKKETLTLLLNSIKKGMYPMCWILDLIRNVLATSNQLSLVLIVKFEFIKA